MNKLLSLAKRVGGGRFWLAMLALALVWLGTAAVKAEEKAGLSQAYKSSQSVTPGTLVSLDTSSSDAIVAASQDRTDALLGVVVKSDEALLTLSSGKADDVQVATSGVAMALVSNVNGDIKAGDKIAVSPITGVGAKAVLSGKVVGTAQTDFTASSADKREVEIASKTGPPQKVLLGRIPILVNVSFYSAKTEDSLIPSSIQSIFDALARKQVSLVKIVLSILLLSLALVVVSVLIYSAARNSIISIGRNPLSQPAVRRSLFSVIFIAAAILLITLMAVYFIISR